MPDSPLLAAAPRLVGRSTELRELTEFLDALPEGGEARLLVGDAGVGKTRLLLIATELAHQRGFLVLDASGAQFEADISYAGLNRILLPLADEIGTLPEHLQEALTVALGLGEGAAPRPLVVYNAALALLSAAARERPVLLVVDDLPWLDRASSSALGFIARRLRGSRVGLLASFRFGEASFFERSGLQEIEVLPLDRAYAERLITAEYPELSLRVRQILLDEAAGNPLAILELGRSADSSDLGQASSQIPANLTRRLENAFEFRFADLPDHTRDALRLIAFDGRNDLSELSRAGLNLDHLAAAETAGLVATDLDSMTVRFNHPLMRSAVVERSTSDERRRTHRALAQHLDHDSERQSWHLAEAAVEPDESIAARLEQTARIVLQRGDATAAIIALTRAAKLSPDRQDQSRRLTEAAFLGADITGELASAQRLLEDAQRADPAATTSLHAAAAAAYMLVNGDGNIETAHQLLVNALTARHGSFSPDDTEVVEAVGALLLVCWWAGRTEFWVPLFDALARFEPENPEPLHTISRTFPDTARATPADRDNLIELIAEQNRRFDPNSVIRVNTASVYLDLLNGGREAAWRLVEDGRRGGAIRSSLGALMHLALDDYARGRWDEQRDLADEGVAICREHGYNFIVYYFQFHESLHAAVHGDTGQAHQWAEDLIRTASLRHAEGAAKFAYHPLTLAAQADGDWEAAYQYATRLSPAGELAPYTPHALWVAYDLVEAAVRTRRDEEARAHVTAMEDLQLEALSSRLALWTAGARALVSGQDDYVEAFERAITVPDAEQWPFDLARVQLAYGERLRRQIGGLGRAREVLHGALAHFERLGATPWEERAREELRAARDPGARKSGADTSTLTAQELSIAELAAEGLSNKQIAERLYLSPRTVSGHLYRAFPKLGITSRAALRDALIASRRTRPTL